DRNEPPDPSRPRAFNSWRLWLQLPLLLQTAEGFQLVAVGSVLPDADGQVLSTYDGPENILEQDQ
ncbi:MAG: hypothetical protein ABEJ27_04860, partial [Halodesulfurarchaeum sp.]